MDRTLAGTPLALTALLTVAACGGTPAPRAQPDFATSTRQAPAVPDSDSTALPPWPAPRDVEARVAQAGLNLGQMGAADHYHPTLRIVVNGAVVPVPANIGVDTRSGAMSALHTHETDGTIHIEAPEAGQIFTLGQLFTEWGVRLSKTQVGGVRATSNRALVITSNGRRVVGNPRDVQLQPDQQIVIEAP